VYIKYTSGRRRERNEAWRRNGGNEVASRSPGTYGYPLWLLPSGPDQIHEPAMRGDPPLIGAHRAKRHYTGRTDEARRLLHRPSL
jgi:hypothetical protein